MTAAEAVREVYEREGRLTADLLVEAARPEDHPLHERIWGQDDAEAAYEWRREQARVVIRSFRITFREPSEDASARSTRQYVSVWEGEQNRVYRDSEEVARDPFQRQLVLRDMERRFKSLAAEYGAFKEFAALVDQWREDQAA